MPVIRLTPLHAVAAPRRSCKIDPLTETKSASQHLWTELSSALMEWHINFFRLRNLSFIPNLLRSFSFLKSRMDVKFYQTPFLHLMRWANHFSHKINPTWSQCSILFINSSFSFTVLCRIFASSLNCSYPFSYCSHQALILGLWWLHITTHEHILSFSIFWNSCARLELLVPATKISGSGFFFWGKILNWRLKIFHDYFATWMFYFFLESILANCNLFISPSFLYLYAKICHDISSYLLIFKDMCLAHAAILFFMYTSALSPLFLSASLFKDRVPALPRPPIELSPKESTWWKLDTYGLWGP